MQKWFFVASYVVTDKNKLTERDVNNDIPHCTLRGIRKRQEFIVRGEAETVP